MKDKTMLHFFYFCKKKIMKFFCRRIVIEACKTCFYFSKVKFSYTIFHLRNLFRTIQSLEIKLTFKKTCFPRHCDHFQNFQHVIRIPKERVSLSFITQFIPRVVCEVSFYQIIHNQILLTQNAEKANSHHKNLNILIDNWITIL